MDQHVKIPQMQAMSTGDATFGTQTHKLPPEQTQTSRTKTYLPYTKQAFRLDETTT